jgi:hypothetical protein
MIDDVDVDEFVLFSFQGDSRYGESAGEDLMLLGHFAMATTPGTARKTVIQTGL